MRTLNSLHPCLKFTVEKERERSLPFMDVRVTRKEKLVRSVYRKPTFTGLYTRWDSFCPTQHKTNLVRSLVNRAIKICSSETLEEELDMLKEIFSKNGYPMEMVKRIMESVANLPAKAITVRESSIVLVRLPWIGEISKKFKKEVEEIIIKACTTTKPIVSFTTTHAFNPNYKDVLPTTAKSLLVYNYKCCCGKQYVGKTTQVLSERIKQHVARKLIDGKTEKRVKIEKNDSAVTKHLKGNPECIPLEPERCFTVLARARNKSHLDVLEAVFIRTLSPDMCQQKEFTKQIQLQI